MPDVDFTRITIPDTGHSLFLCRMPPRGVSPTTFQWVREAWAKAWKVAGRDKPPALLIVMEPMTISALSDAELADAGLMRIPEGT